MRAEGEEWAILRRVQRGQRGQRGQSRDGGYARPAPSAPSCTVPLPLSLGATSRLSRLALCCGRFGWVWVLWTADGCRRVSGLSTLHTLQVCMFGVDGCSGYRPSPITLPARHMVRREPASCRRFTTVSQRDQPTPGRPGTGEPPSPRRPTTTTAHSHPRTPRCPHAACLAVMRRRHACLEPRWLPKVSCPPLALPGIPHQQSAIAAHHTPHPHPTANLYLIAAAPASPTCELSPGPPA
jgi:hypothetical protein